MSPLAIQIEKLTSAREPRNKIHETADRSIPKAAQVQTGIRVIATIESHRLRQQIITATKRSMRSAGTNTAKVFLKVRHIDRFLTRS
jgi:hypothetical protein